MTGKKQDRGMVMLSASVVDAKHQKSPAKDWVRRTGFVGQEFAKKLLTDPRISLLSLDAIGLLTLLQAKTMAGFPIPAEPAHAARSIGIATRVWKSTIEQLTGTIPPLVCEVDGFFYAQPVGYNANPELSMVRSAAASLRWSSEAGQENGKSSPVSEEIPGSDDLAGAAKMRKKRVEIAESLDGDLFSEMLPTVATIEEHSDPIRASVRAVSARLQAGTVLHQDAASTLPDSEEPRRRKTDCPFEEIRQMFVDICRDLPKVHSVPEWPESRKVKMLKLWKRHPDLEFWKAYFERVQASDFLCCRSNTGSWRADFNWLIKHENFIKVCEGNFNNNRNGKVSLFNAGGLYSEQNYAESEISEENEFLQLAQKKSGPDLGKGVFPQ